jgi:hypothetical protein
MLFSELYSSALDHELGTDDSTRLFTTGRRKRAINRGLQEFCNLTGCAKRQSTITCSNGVAEYNLNSTSALSNGDFARYAPQRPEYYKVSSGSSASTTFQVLERREIPWLNDYAQGWRTSTGGTPESYYDRPDGGQRFFGLQPPPQIGSSESGRVILPYLARPSSMTADTNVPFSFADTNGSTTREDLEPYHQALVHFAAAELEKLRRDYEAVQYQTQQFLGYVARFTQQQEPMGGMQIRQARSYFAEVKRRRTGDDDDISGIPLGNLS